MRAKHSSKTGVRTTVLPGGLTVVTAELPHMASASVGIWASVGGRYESPGVNGVSHFIEHMLFKGTRKRSAREISEAVEGIGGYLNAFTDEELTCFYARVAHSHFVPVFDVLADMYLNSVFAPAEIRKERDVIKEELAMYLDQPHQRVQEMLAALIWPRHPLGRPLTGTNASLDRLDRDAMLKFKRRHYCQSATLVSAAGNVDHAKVVSIARRLLGRIPRGRRPVFEPTLPAPSTPRLKILKKATEQTQIALGLRVCNRHDPRRHAVRLINTVLGENMSSRLFQRVREDAGLAYSIYSSLAWFSDDGVLTISAGLDSTRVEKAFRLVLAELRRLTRTRLSTAELRRARDYLIGQFDLQLESTENQMMYLGEQTLAFGKVHSPTEIRDRLNTVTPADIQNAAEAFFKPHNLNLAVISPAGSARPFRKILGLD